VWIYGGFVNPLAPLNTWIFLIYAIPLLAILLLVGTGTQFGHRFWLPDSFSRFAVCLDLFVFTGAILWLVLDIRLTMHARKFGMWYEALWQDEWAAFLWAF
jgi:predicted small integral membrane protein